MITFKLIGYNKNKRSQSSSNYEDKCQSKQEMHTGQTHPYIHILDGALMLTATIKPVLSVQALALWPCCWRSVSNDAVSSGNKTGRRKLRGQSRSWVETPHVLKQLPLRPNPGLASELSLSSSFLLLQKSVYTRI